MDYEYEPMEIDLSSNSNHAMDISYSDMDCKNLDVECIAPEIKVKEEHYDPCYVDSKEISTDREVQPVPAPTIIKRFSLKVPVRKEKIPFMSTTFISIIFILLGLFSLLTYQMIDFECSSELHLEAIRQSLLKNLVGQSQAIKEIVGALETESSSKLLLLYGGTGVGKTLTISLILENLHRYANIYHYTMPSFIDILSTEIMLGLTLCPSSMIIVDDLNRTDMHVSEHVKNLFEKSEKLNKNITVILSFNCDSVNDQYIKKCDYLFYSELKHAFKGLQATKTFIKFNSLNEDNLKTCIEKELGNKKLSDEELKNIIKNFNVSVDGCKGVYMKMKLLNVV